MTNPDPLAATRFAFLTPRVLPKAETLAGRVVVEEVAPHAMGLPRPHHIREPEDPAGQAKHVAIGANHRLASQLTGPVG